MGCASSSLNQPGDAFDAADLKDLLQWREIDAQVQRRGAHHAGQLASFQRRFDGLSLFAIQGAVMQGNAIL